MRRIEEAKHMIVMAQKDLRALKGMLSDRETFSDEVFGFHAEQAVEKGLKAWLILNSIEYPKIHDLEQLFALLEESGVIFPEKFRNLIDLVDFAIQYRYEFFDEEVPLDRAGTDRAVSDFVSFVESRIRDCEEELTEPD